MPAAPPTTVPARHDGAGSLDAARRGSVHRRRHHRPAGRGRHRRRLSAATRSAGLVDDPNAWPQVRPVGPLLTAIGVGAWRLGKRTRSGPRCWSPSCRSSSSCTSSSRTSTACSRRTCSDALLTRPMEAAGGRLPRNAAGPPGRRSLVHTCWKRPAPRSIGGNTAADSRSRASLCPATLSGASSAIALGPAPSASSRPPMRCTQPERVGLLALETCSAASSIARAADPPTSRATGAGRSRRRPSARAGWRGCRSRRSVAATRRSQAIASCVPAPSAAPSTAAMVTAGSSVSPVSTAGERAAEAVALDAGEVGAGAERAAGAGEHEHADPCSAAPRR